jgi:hypothetical protein
MIPGGREYSLKRSAEVVGGAVLDVDEIGFDAASGCVRRPTLGDEADWEFFRAEQLQASVAFGPGDWQRVLLGVNVDTCGAKGCDTPVDGLSHLRGAGDAAADFVGEAAEILFQRRGSHDDGKDFSGGCGAGGFGGGAGCGGAGGLAGERIGLGRQLGLD